MYKVINLEEFIKILKTMKISWEDLGQVLCVNVVEQIMLTANNIAYYLCEDTHEIKRYD